MRPWYTPEVNIDWDRSITLLIVLVTMFLLLYSVGTGGDILTLIQQNINLVYIIFMLGFSYTQMSGKNPNYGGIGENKNIKRGILLGAVVAAIMVFSAGIKLATPLASTLSSSEALALFYIAFIVPFAEEKFFGNTLPFVFDRNIKNSFVTFALCGVLFGLFHLIAYSGNVAYIVAAIVFRFMASYGNQELKTSTFGWTVHYINNISQVARKFMGM